MLDPKKTGFSQPPLNRGWIGAPNFDDTMFTVANHLGIVLGYPECKRGKANEPFLIGFILVASPCCANSGFNQIGCARAASSAEGAFRWPHCDDAFWIMAIMAWGNYPSMVEMSGRWIYIIYPEIVICCLKCLHEHRPYLSLWHFLLSEVMFVSLKSYNISISSCLVTHELYIYIIYIYVYTIIINYILLYIVNIYIIYILYDNYHFTYLYLQNQGCRSKKPSIIRIQPLVLWPGLLLLFGVVWVQASWWIGLTSKLSIGFSVLFFSAIIGLTYRDSKRWLIELMKYVQKFTLINHNEPI
jgi:hypothetical protein